MATFPTTGQKPWGAVLKAYIDDLVNGRLPADAVVPDANLPSRLSATSLTTAQQAAIDTAIANLRNGVPAAMDTLKELADQLASDETAAGALTTLLTQVRNLTDPTIAASLSAAMGAQAFTQARALNLRAATGVDPTGATDSTTAMQAAVDSAIAAGRSVEIPDGIYKGSIAWRPGNNKDIYLKGLAGSSFKAVADGTPVITINGGASNYQRQVLSDLKVDLDGKDAPAFLLEGFGQFGVMERVLISGMAATPTRAAVEIGDGTTSPNDSVFGILRDIEVKGPGTTVGKAFLFRSPADSFTLERCRGLNVGTAFANDPTTSHGGSTIALLRCIAEQCQDGFSFTAFEVEKFLLWGNRVEAFSRYGMDLNGIDSNYVMGGVTIEDNYFSGMTAVSTGVRLSKAAGVAVDKNNFTAVNGLSSGSYPAGTPIEIGANVSRYRQRGNRNGLSVASGAILMTDSVGPMAFPVNFLPSTDIRRDQTSSDVPNQVSATTTVFTASGTFTRDIRAKAYQVICIGGGGGAGSGRRGAASTARCGGGGGGGGQVTRAVIPASAVAADVAVTMGAGGAGGAAVTVDDTNGNNGTAGAASLFGTFAKAGGGGAGSGGTSAAGAGASTSTASGQFGGGAGGSAGVAGAVGGASPSVAAGAAGGGGGGGVNAADATSAGGLGGVVGAHASGGLGSAGTAPGGAGGAGTDSPTDSGIPGPSGGGGASSITGSAGAGGKGGKYGGGGGGGGASLNGSNSGKGGDGADGIIIVTALY